MSVVDRYLSRARRRMFGAQITSMCADVLCIVCVAACVLVLIDCTSPLLPWVRVGLVVLSFIGGAVVVWRAMVRCRVPIGRVAVRIEEAIGLERNTLINAVQLSHMPAGGAVAIACSNEAMRRAEMLVSEHPSPIVTDRGRLMRSSVRCAVGVIALAAMLLFAPRMASYAWSRFTEPFAGHPPYSRTDFVISIDPPEPLVTQDVRVRIEARLKVPRDLALVIEHAGGRAERIVMAQLSSESPGIFGTMLTRLETPIVAHAEGPTGRSRSFVITPIDKPIIEAAFVRMFEEGAEEGVVTIELPIDGTLRVIRPKIGAHVELVVTSSVALSDARAGVGAVAVNDRVARCEAEVESAEPFVLSLTPVSRSGIECDESVSVRIEPVVPVDTAASKRDADDLAQSAESSGAREDEPKSDMDVLLGEIIESLDEMTDEQAAEAAGAMIERIDEVLANKSNEAERSEASAQLAMIREALAEVIEGNRASLSKARSIAKEVSEDRPSDEQAGQDAEKGDPESDRDELVADGSREQPAVDTPVSPTRLEGDTLIVRGSMGDQELRVTLNGAARDLYTSLDGRERAIVARYFRALARAESEKAREERE